MRIRLLDIRPGERRNAIVAFLILFGMVSGHMLLETARDSLFLAKLPPSRLPVVYLLIAALALAVSELQQRSRNRHTGKTELCLWLAAVAVVDLGFWALLGRVGAWSLYALYVWSGLVSTMLVIRFWVVAGDLFTVTQAKRLFAFVGTGSILGAIGGAAVAQRVVLNGDATDLLPAAAVVMALTAGTPLLLRLPEPERTARFPAADEPPPDLVETFRAIRAHPYVKRVALLGLLSTVTFTVVDYTFKSSVAAAVKPEELGYVFATTYLILSVFSLVVQLTIVGWITRTVSMDRMLAILPTLIAAGAAWMAAGGGILAAFLVKGVDGMVRYSLHRTSTEVLYVPLSREWRNRAKSFIDVVAQRGGQAIASVALLAAAALGAPTSVFGLLLMLLCVAWGAVALGLKRPYFDLFRDTLDERAIRTRIDFPELDLASLESLMGALNSTDDAQVLAAMELLREKQRTHLIPPLILYHPSARVVVQALEIFEQSERSDYCAHVDRLFDHADASVRAAALIATAASRSDALERFEAGLSDESPDVRATALVCLISATEETHPRVQSILDTLILAGSAEAKRSLAAAIGARPSRRFDGVLMSLSGHPDDSVGLEVAQAMQRAPKPIFIPALMGLLERRATRVTARRVLVSIGDEALEQMHASMADEHTPEAVRLHLPRSVSRFPAEDAAPILLERLQVEESETVRYKLLRGLGAVRKREPSVRLDPNVLDRIIDRTLEHIFLTIDWQITLAEHERTHPEWKTPVRGLITRLMRFNERHAVERLFRLFSLRYPKEDFRRIHRGVEGGGRAELASSRELLEQALPSPVREAVLGLIDDVPDERRLASGVRYHRRRRRSEQELFRELLQDGSAHVACLVAHHADEIGMIDGVAELKELCKRALATMDDLLKRSRDLLDHGRKERAFVVPLR